MAQVPVFNGELLKVKIGNGADPEVFAVKCMINTTRGLSLKATTSQEEVPDCADPTLPAATSTEITGYSGTISGAGMTDKTDLAFFTTWLTTGVAKNCRIGCDDAGSGYWSGAFKLTQFDVTGDRKKKSTSTIALDLDGPVIFTANA